MRINKQKWNWMTDAVLLVGVLAAFFLDLTGLPLHQWLGVAVGLLAGYHFLLHRDWVKSVTLRFWGQTSKQAQRYYVIDASLMFGFAAILVTGLMISSWFALPLENYAAWRDAHVAASIITLLVVAGKIGLHWRWIVNTAQRLFPAPDAPATTALPRQAVPASAQMDRRRFLTLMGTVGVAAVIAISHVLDDEKGILADESVRAGLIPEEAGQQKTAPGAQSLGSSQQATPTPITLPSASSPSTTSSANPSAAACVVRCNKGCSYPGHCRRYVDTNKNNRCDMGECM